LKNQLKIQHEEFVIENQKAQAKMEELLERYFLIF